MGAGPRVNETPQASDNVSTVLAYLVEANALTKDASEDAGCAGVDSDDGGDNDGSDEDGGGGGGGETEKLTFKTKREQIGAKLGGMLRMLVRAELESREEGARFPLSFSLCNDKAGQHEGSATPGGPPHGVRTGVSRLLRSDSSTRCFVF